MQRQKPEKHSAKEAEKTKGPRANWLKAIMRMSTISCSMSGNHLGTHWGRALMPARECSGLVDRNLAEVGG